MLLRRPGIWAARKRMLCRRVDNTNERTRDIRMGSLEDWVLMTETMAELSVKNLTFLLANVEPQTLTAKEIGRSSLIAILKLDQLGGKEAWNQLEPRTAAKEEPEASVKSLRV